MDSENNRDVFQQQVGGVQGAQEHRNECGLPVVAVDYVGGPNVFGDFDDSATEFAITFGVVGKISGAVAVGSVAIKVAGIVDEKVADTVEHGAIGNGGETQPSAQRDCDAGHNRHARFNAPVTRQHHGQFVALCDQGFGQRLDYIGEAAGLREGQAFGCRKKYSQNKLTEGAAPRCG